MPRSVFSLLAAALATAVAFWIDPWAWRQLSYQGVYEHDWGRLLRIVGSLLFWLPLTLALWLELRARRSAIAGRSWLLLAAPAVAGGMGELLKLLIRRERPGLHDGEYVFRAFAERPFDSHDLGFPSSHVTVAFGGAAVVARLYPRAGAVAYLLAAGCAVTRVLSQAHFVSDAVAGGIVGWAVGAWMCRRFGLHSTPGLSP